MQLIIRKIKVIDFINGTVLYYNRKYNYSSKDKINQRIEEELLFYY
jgi:hypothetical protein